MPKDVQSSTTSCFDKGMITSAQRLKVMQDAKSGDSQAQYLLGMAFTEGIPHAGMPQDFKKAAMWYRHAAERGHADAQFNLGCVCFSGCGVPQDHTEAVAWFRKAANQGHSAALCKLGLLYFVGVGVPQDDNKAAKLLSRAAEQGDSLAQCYMGVLHHSGRGVTKDSHAAAKWLYKALEQKDIPETMGLAEYYIGRMCLDGEGGHKKDAAVAVAWLAKAAKHEQVQAQYMLGLLYADGNHGLRQDHAKAAEWFQKAAAKGVVEAHRQLKLLQEKLSSKEGADGVSQLKTSMLEAPSNPEQQQQGYSEGKSKDNSDNGDDTCSLPALEVAPTFTFVE